MVDSLHNAVNALTKNTILLHGRDFRAGDIVLFCTDPEADPQQPEGEPEAAHAGYVVLHDLEHYYSFSPYEEHGEPRITPLPKNSYLYYHDTLPVHPKHLSLSDTLTVLWRTHDRAFKVAHSALLLEHEIQDFEPGELLLQERLDGYLEIAYAGTEEPYEAPPQKKHRWSKDAPLATRPYMKRLLLRIPKP